MHIKFPKIHSLGKGETDGILYGECIIQEKIDGANASIRLEDGEVCIGSRTQLICNKGNILNHFNGLCEYVLKNEKILGLLYENPTYRLYGERLVQHTIRYSLENYHKFWLYDILLSGDSEYPNFMNPIEVNKIAIEKGIHTPRIFNVMNNPSYDDVIVYLDKPNLGDAIEGIVIKNTNFINQYGRHCYAKIVSERFKEENKIVFGNSNKFDSIESRRAIKYTTPGRFLKLVNKIEQEKGFKFSSSNISEILGRMQYDIISEEICSIVKNEIVNFSILRKEIINITRTMCLQYTEQGEQGSIFIYNKQGNDENSNA